jgi:uncharacterized protein (TIGR02145 family)
MLGCSKKLSDAGYESVRDKHSNTYSVRLMKDGKRWLVQNLDMNLAGSYCYNDSIANCSKYGRLYTWESAREGCAQLGKEWHLPTNAEWEEMASLYGGIRTDAGQDGREAYKRLIAGGDSEFNILFGGTRDPSGDYRRVEAHGFFWTATASDSAHAWFYNLGKGGQLVNRHSDGEKSSAVSVRCVRP